MGMFDYVDFECICPVCLNHVTGFQTKDKYNVLETVKPQELCNFYTTCDKCGSWIEFTRNEEGRFVRYVYDKQNNQLKEYDKLIITLQKSGNKYTDILKKETSDLPIVAYIYADKIVLETPNCTVSLDNMYEAFSFIKGFRMAWCNNRNNI